VDQSPIGKTSRSNPATYLQVLAPIRDLFAGTKDALARATLPAASASTPPAAAAPAARAWATTGWRCSSWPTSPCPARTAAGSRFNAQHPGDPYKGLNIAQVLDLTVEDALAVLRRRGRHQPAPVAAEEGGAGLPDPGPAGPTLSGGESQRLKVARELAMPSGQHNLYLLDEPTTGLHAEDVKALVKVLHELVEREHSVLVIEHNLDLIAQADWIIDLGPGGGRHGGKVVAQGTPLEVAEQEGASGADVPGQSPPVPSETIFGAQPGSFWFSRHTPCIFCWQNAG
jgi:excinuclease ABC subunit A